MRSDTGCSGCSFALTSPLLLALYALPYALAGKMTAAREEEKADLIEAIHEHERHEGHEAKDAGRNETP